MYQQNCVMVLIWQLGRVRKIVIIWLTCFNAGTENLISELYSMILFNKTHSVDSFGNTGQIRLFDNNSNNSNKNINNANNCNNNNNNIYLTIYVL